LNLSGGKSSAIFKRAEMQKFTAEYNANRANTFNVNSLLRTTKTQKIEAIKHAAKMSKSPLIMRPIDEVKTKVKRSPKKRKRATSTYSSSEEEKKPKKKGKGGKTKGKEIKMEKEKKGKKEKKVKKVKKKKKEEKEEKEEEEEEEEEEDNVARKLDSTLSEDSDTSNYLIHEDGSIDLQYEVEKILGKRLVGRESAGGMRTQFLVKWRDSSRATWEEETRMDCPDAIDAFNCSQQTDPNTGVGALHAARKSPTRAVQIYNMLVDDAITADHEYKWKKLWAQAESMAAKECSNADGRQMRSQRS
jgi:hypothetical protein